MYSKCEYSGSLTAEQFMFYEIRVASRFFNNGIPVTDAIKIISEDNLFQYPTEREVARMVRACYKRLSALDNSFLTGEIESAPSEIAKQINLYAIMRYNRLVWDFMIEIIGEKFKSQDLSYSRAELNTYFSRLQAQNDRIASWSNGTINKIKSVLTSILVENEYLDSAKSSVLNPIYLCEELERGILQNHDEEVLPAFNSFR